MIKAERTEEPAEDIAVQPKAKQQEEICVSEISTAYSGLSKAVAMSHSLRNSVNEMLKFADVRHAYPLWYAWLLEHSGKVMQTTAPKKNFNKSELKARRSVK